MKSSKQQQIRELTEELRLITVAHAKEKAALRDEIKAAEVRRIAAQDGLTPYVTAVEALNLWLTARPVIQAAIQPILMELGLFGVRVGYDPKRDIALSVLYPRRSA